MTAAAPKKPAPKPKPKPPLGVPSPKDWLAGDEDYSNFINNLNQAKNLNTADYTRNRAFATTNYDTQLGQLQKMMPQRRESTWEDFAARGMSQSGAFANALQDVSKQDVLDRQALDVPYNQQMSDLTSGLSQFNLQDKSSRQQARSASLRRRLQRLNSRVLQT